jgi:hypothetical protein
MMKKASTSGRYMHRIALAVIALLLLQRKYTPEHTVQLKLLFIHEFFPIPEFGSDRRLLDVIRWSKVRFQLELM